MRTVLLLLITATILGGLLGALMVRDPGYVLLAYGGQALETSFWFAALLLLALYFLARLILLTGGRLIRGKRLFGAWQGQRRERVAQRQTAQGLVLLEEGQWQEAKRLLLDAAPSGSTPLVNYLNAARAAQELKQPEERDELLHQAQQALPGSRTALALTLARWQMADGHWQAAKAALQEMRGESPKHPQLLALLARCHEALREWQALIELLPNLRKAKAQDAEALAALERRAWRHRLQEADGAEAWRRLPKALRQEPELIAARARSMLHHGDFAAAEAALRKALSQGWHEELAGLYGQVPSPNLKRQLAFAEQLLEARPEHPGLLLALGRLAISSGDWPSARDYLEESLRLAPSPPAYAELGRLLIQTGDPERGRECLAKACLEAPQAPPAPAPVPSSA